MEIFDAKSLGFSDSGEQENIASIIEAFASKCRKLDRGQEAKLLIGDKKIVVLRDGFADIEFGNLFDIFTYANGESVDDEMGVWFGDLTQALKDIVFERKEFSTID